MDHLIKKSLKMHLEMWQSSGATEIITKKAKVLINTNSVSQKTSTVTPLPPKKELVSNIPGELGELRNEIGNCTRCGLHKGITHLVFGVGNPKAELMFVGEAPGADEDLQGEPFIGRAGQLLTKMIKAMGIKRSDVYIANIVKCRPPQNRNPEPLEIATCQPFLKRQIDIINPKIIVTLGKFASQTLLQTEIPITKLRGEFNEYGKAKLMPTYHPAFLLRNPNMKRFVWEDLQKVMDALGLSKKPN